MKDWLEIQTAYHVAKLGTVSAAAEYLGVHRATVIRHINTLEARLGAKIFRRHSKGYSKTELGEEFLSVAERIDDEVARFVGRTKIEKTRITGDLTIATSPPTYPPTIVAATRTFRKKHSDVAIHYSICDTPPKLEWGEAHIYFHFGPKLETPEYVVRPFLTYHGGLYAHRSYIEQHGKPNGVDHFAKHIFALLTPEVYSPPNDWLRKHTSEENVILTSNDRLTVFRAVTDGLAIGCLPAHVAAQHTDVFAVIAPLPDCESICWAVTHMDMHRSTKVQSFFQCLREVGIMGLTDEQIKEPLYAV
ncbi:MAG: LysR family transcriptional regulator [Pseudomonadota bacterium]